MPEPSAPLRVQVPCAHCRQWLDVNRYLVDPLASDPTGAMHFAAPIHNFSGTVKCPTCGHFTIYKSSSSA